MGIIPLNIYIKCLNTLVLYNYTYILKWNFPIWVQNVPSKSQRLSIKLSNNRHMKPSCGLLAKVFQKSPETLRTIPIALGCPPEVEGKLILLKTPCTSDSGLRCHWAGTKLSAASIRISICYCRRYHISFQSREATIKVTYEPQQLTWQNNLTHTVVGPTCWQ